MFGDFKIFAFGIKLDLQKGSRSGIKGDVAPQQYSAKVLLPSKRKGGPHPPTLLYHISG